MSDIVIKLKDTIIPQEKTEEKQSFGNKFFSSAVDIYTFYTPGIEYITLQEGLEILTKLLSAPKLGRKLNSVTYQYQMEDLRTIQIDVLPYRINIRRVD